MMEEDKIGVRIGLGSGPVFAVTNMNNVQNVCGALLSYWPAE
jgi:hypothetical protein